MNFRSKNLKLLARNEGRIKSFESCSDLRAWSHSAAQRDLYLRDWMRSDMPVCILPACSITSLFSGDSGSGTQRCHPACKSKGILDSICNTCDALRDCLKQDGRYQRYFEEEEFETCHWPCERCLEALKTIKLFWKVVAEKIFRVNFSSLETKKSHLDVPSKPNSCCKNSVQEIAKEWQKDMIKSAHCILKQRNSCDGDKIYRSPLRTGSHDSIANRRESKRRSSRRNVSLMTDSEIRSRCKSTAEKVKRCNRKSQCGFPRGGIMREVSCGACLIEEEITKARDYKTNLDNVLKRYNVQKDEIEKLKQENSKLKAELLTVFYPPNDQCASPSSQNSIKSGLFKTCPVEIDKPVEKLRISHPLTDSEMIITLKNCKSQRFQYVSLLQVLHKTNDPSIELSLEEPFLKDEDPIAVLNKVQKTFGDIVSRELNIAKDKNRWQKNRFNVDATVQRLGNERPSGSLTASTITTYKPACSE